MGSPFSPAQRSGFRRLSRATGLISVLGAGSSGRSSRRSSAFLQVQAACLFVARARIGMNPTKSLFASPGSPWADIQGTASEILSQRGRLGHRIIRVHNLIGRQHREAAKLLGGDFFRRSGSPHSLLWPPIAPAAHGTRPLGRPDTPHGLLLISEGASCSRGRLHRYGASSFFFRLLVEQHQPTTHSSTWTLAL
jgi:hypothetical protein